MCLLSDQRTSVGQGLDCTFSWGLGLHVGGGRNSILCEVLELEFGRVVRVLVFMVGD